MSSKKKTSATQQAEYQYHLPVLLKESCDFLVTDEDGLYIDGTLGGGGHTAEILRRLSERGKLLAFDRDEEAIAWCSAKFRGELEKGAGNRLELINDNFSKACSITSISGKTQGILLDLGVSSRQLDESRRGFSYRVDGVLDLRFSSQGQSAQDIINSATEDELVKILRSYGEEPFAKSIARRIVQRRRVSSLRTTFDLRSAVSESVSPNVVLKSLSRVFQAFRIAVNEELTSLQETLENIAQLLAPGGRVVVISYHSLEDRIVKNVFRDKSNFQRPELKILTKKPIVPSDEEIANNSRARSGKMRAAEKILF